MDKLTDEDWANVFTVRCRSKRGERLSVEEHNLLERAYFEDRKRYTAINERVYNDTKPFGSQ